MTNADPARSDRFLIAVAGGLLVLIVIAAMWREASSPWSEAQASVRAAVAERMGAEKAAEVPSGIQQIWIPELDRVDRCTSCHVTVEWGDALADAPHPARSHPHPELMAAHPVESFGCTLCHGGQGQATTRDAAHGHVAHWEEPLLDTALAKQYGLSRRELMELRCATCHTSLDPVEGMPLLNAAKDRAFDCIDCHRVPGIEPSDKPTAPDLTREGEKHPTKYAFPDDWQGETTALRWHIQHFLDPRSMSKGSGMTRFPMTEKEAAGLSLLVMSWRRQVFPAAWIPAR